MSAYLEEFEQESIWVKWVPYVDSTPTEIWSWNFVAPGWDKDTPARLLADAALAGRNDPPGYALDVRRSYFEWGASNQAQTVVLQIADWALQGVVGAAAWAVLARLCAAAKKSMEVPLGVRPLERDEAEGWARWRIVDGFELGHEAYDHLILVGEEEARAELKWTLAYEHDGVRYTVTIGTREGLVDFARIKRELA